MHNKLTAICNMKALTAYIIAKCLLKHILVHRIFLLPAFQSTSLPRWSYQFSIPWGTNTGLGIAPEIIQEHSRKEVTIIHIKSSSDSFEVIYCVFYVIIMLVNLFARDPLFWLFEAYYAYSSILFEENIKENEEHTRTREVLTVSSHSQQLLPKFCKNCQTIHKRLSWMRSETVLEI